MTNLLNPRFKVKITHNGSEKAKPAIWYAGMEDKIFTVEKSKRWKSVYEVVTGKYSTLLIDPSDCVKIG